MMLKPDVSARTGLHKDRLTVQLDFHFRVGKIERRFSDSGPFTRFAVFLGALAVAECYRYSPMDDWEFRWLPHAPDWLRGFTSIRHGLLTTRKPDAAKHITRAFEHAFRSRFREFETEAGR